MYYGPATKGNNSQAGFTASFVYNNQNFYY